MFWKIVFILSSFEIFSLSIAAEELTSKYKTYLILETKGLKTFNGGPIMKRSKIDDRRIKFWSPQLNKETEDIKPRPQGIEKAIKEPEQVFISDAKEAIKSFTEFSKEYRECVSSKKWPQRFECFNKVDICFGEEHESGLCNWNMHEKFDKCAPQDEGKLGLVNCLSNSEQMFDLLNGCFDANTELAFMFEVFGEKASRRDYYTLDSRYVGKGGNNIECRFSVTNKKNYHLIGISRYGFFRPPFTLIPLDVYVKDNYYQLLQLQKSDLRK